MTLSEAKQIVLKYRPERPRSTENRRLQKAIDVIFDSLDAYETAFNMSDVTINLRDKVKYSGCFACPSHVKCIDAFQPHSPYCGAYGDNAEDTTK